MMQLVIMTLFTCILASPWVAAGYLVAREVWWAVPIAVALGLTIQLLAAAINVRQR